jgi:ESS family glutamate:Na+ symporter
MRSIWSQTPAVLINVVFATLFLGESIPSPRAIWRKAAPQIAFSQTLAWGQYVVGLGVTLWLLTPVWHVNPMAASLIEMAFEGGHGTVAGMANSLKQLGFEAGPDLAYLLPRSGLSLESPSELL